MVIFLRSWLVLLPMAVIARAATSATVAQHIELTFSFFVETGVVPLVQAAALAWGLAACPWPSFSRALPRLWRPTHVVVGSITAAVLVVVLLRGSTGELAGVGVGRAASVLAGVELIVAAGLWCRAMGRLGRRVLPLVSIAAGAGVLATLDPGWLLEVADLRLPDHFVGTFVWGACGVLLVVAVLVAAPVLSTTARALALSAGVVTAIAVSLLTVIDFLHVFYLGRQFDLQRLALVLVAGLFLIAAAEREGGDVAETRLGAELDRVDWPWMVLLLMAGALAARGALSLV
ncbi:MAG: hypothetical protein GY925_13680, partial [Actinomycetia bacterium]|nr:hypothetical protein [Actinomycetes bacterium]